MLEFTQKKELAMQKLFDEVGSLDRRCYDKFHLSEDILMEHASDSMADYIRANFKRDSKILIVCGSGNNGADGMALARLLHVEYDVCMFYLKEPKSPMAVLQNKRAHSIGLKIAIELNESDVIVDAVYGTGFRGEFNYEAKAVMQTLNRLNAFKIACDIPSGLKVDGQCEKDTFVADVSLTMGALKKSMFLDEAKEFVGEIKVLDLGLSRELYESSSRWNLLDKEDMKLPYRTKKNTHKGSYGHLALTSGEKSGASILSALAALRFGSGLVTLVGFKDVHTPNSIMHSHTIPSNSTALAIGMGLGDEFSSVELDAFLDNSLPLIADADIFNMPIIETILKRKNSIITPHPKEFVELLKRVNIADISVEVLQKNRFKYVETFCKNYPDVTLLLKGSNVIIGRDGEFYINTFGTQSLAKGGSGDVLSGLVGALLAQGYEALDATITASLAHTSLVNNYRGADFSLTPEDLIAGIGNL